MEKCQSKYCGCLYYSANALARIITKLADDAFSFTGLSSSYVFLLMTVNDKPGIQPTEISQQMHLTPSTVTRLIEKMEHKNLLERKQVGRTTEVYPTETSLALNPTFKEAWKKFGETYADLIGKEEGIQLTNQISTAIAKLE